MALTTTDLRQAILDEFNNASIQPDGSIKSGYDTINNYAETVSTNISEAIKEYLEGLQDADGDSIITPIISTGLKSALKTALIYDSNDPENIDITRFDLAIETNLLIMCVGIGFGITVIPPGWLTKISSTSTTASGQIIFFRRSIPDFYAVTNEDQATILTDQIMGIVESTQVLTIGTLPGSPPTPTQRVAAVT